MWADNWKNAFLIRMFLSLGGNYLFALICVVSIPGSSGGICEKSKLYSDGKKKSLNTGIITVQNYASHVPPKVSHITFAHEVGHNFGSPVSVQHVVQHVSDEPVHFVPVSSALTRSRWCSQHDSGPECTPGESKSQDMKEKGNYIMYARATSGDKLNNNKFSVCSVNNITNVLQKKRNNCFVGASAGGAFKSRPAARRRSFISHFIPAPRVRPAHLRQRPGGAGRGVRLWLQRPVQGPVLLRRQPARQQEVQTEAKQSVQVGEADSRVAPPGGAPC